MKIKLRNTSEQIELIKAMASKNGIEANQAREAFAAFIGPVIQQVLNLLGTANQFYVDWPYDPDDDPSFPLDQYYGTSVDHVQVWSQNQAGGLGTSLVTGLQELKINTYALNSAVALTEKNVRRGRLPYVSLALNRMAQELLVRQERNAWIIALRAVGEAQTNGNRHVIASNTANVLQVHDFNAAITRGRIINVAFNNGTPDPFYSQGASDYYLSPEAMQEIRSFVYNPMNVRALPNTDESTSTPLPDSIREQIYRASGNPEVYGKTLHEMNEFGISRAYNDLFDLYDTGINGPGGSAFASGTDELVFGVDFSKEACIRPVSQTPNLEQVTAAVDDQFTRRSGKIGFYTHLEEGRIVIDSRALSGIVF